MSEKTYNFTKEDFRTAITKIIRSAPINTNLYDGLIKAFHTIIDDHLDQALKGKKIEGEKIVVLAETEKGTETEESKPALEAGSEVEPVAEKVEITGEGEAKPKGEDGEKSPNSGPSSLED